MLMRVWQHRTSAIVLATAISLMALPGCVSYQAYEIDATTAQGFEWNGKIRVTEQSQSEIGPFLTFTKRASVSRIELISDDNRNIVILPTSKTQSELVVAKVQDVGSPPDQILETNIQHSPQLKNVMELSVEDQEELMQTINEYLEIAAHIDNRQFDQVSGVQMALHSASSSSHVESTYRLSRDLVVRVLLIDKSLLTVSVEDGEGNVLHRYEPKDLSVTKLDKAHS